MAKWLTVLFAGCAVVVTLSAASYGLYYFDLISDCHY